MERVCAVAIHPAKVPIYTSQSLVLMPSKNLTVKRERKILLNSNSKLRLLYSLIPTSVCFPFEIFIQK